MTHHLLIGIGLLCLALFIGVVFVLESTGRGFGVDSPPGYEQDDIRIVDRTKPDTQADPATLLASEAMAANERARRLLADGIIAPWQLSKLDEQGYLHYEVRPFDTLAKIADTYLGGTSMAAILRDHNPDLIGVDVPQVGSVIKIPIWLRENR